MFFRTTAFTRQLFRLAHTVFIAAEMIFTEPIIVHMIFRYLFGAGGCFCECEDRCCSLLSLEPISG